MSNQGSVPCPPMVASDSLPRDTSDTLPRDTSDTLPRDTDVTDGKAQRRLAEDTAYVAETIDVADPVAELDNLANVDNGPFSSLATGDCSTAYNAFEKWPSSAGSTATDFSALSSFYSASNPLSEFSSSTGRNLFFPPLTGTSCNFYNGAMDCQQQIVDLTSGKTNGVFCGSSMVDSPMLKNVSSALFPPKSQIKRHKMIYHCKFGEFGVMEGQFTEPSGVAVNAQNDVVVADTNNHRIQIFDKEGRFKFQFGECGKRDGQLLYPNRVAVNKATGDIVVTERSTTHQIQVYNQYGQFLRKFGANILQHPRGVTVDHKGRVVVVECKVMRVIIFDLMGSVMQKFGCSKYLEFPNGVVTNDKQDIFISDNRAHCVKIRQSKKTWLAHAVLYRKCQTFC